MAIICTAADKSEARQRKPAGPFGRPRRSTYPAIFGGFFPAVSRDFVAYVGALIQAAQTRSLDGRDMDEHVLAASVGLDEAIALALNHFTLPVATSSLHMDFKTR